MAEVLELNQADIRALLDLIEFHDDWDEVSEIVGVDVAALYDKVSALVTYWWTISLLKISTIWFVWLKITTNTMTMRIKSSGMTFSFVWIKPTATVLTNLSEIMNRSELQDQLIQQMLDDMDLKTMTQLCYDYLDEGYAKYSDEELITECEEYYPELLEEGASWGTGTRGVAVPPFSCNTKIMKNTHL